MKIHVVVNKRAGSALYLSPEQISQTVEKAFRDAGHDVKVDCLDPDQLRDAIAAAVNEPIDVLVVGGGDGTIRSAAAHLVGTKIALGVLPLGTMNRLARDLEIPLTLEAAAHALANGTPGQIDVADVNGKVFLCNSLMGLPPQYAMQRQKLRGKPFRERMSGYTTIIKTLLASRGKLAIAVDDGSDRVRLRALSVAVTNNGYDESASLTLRRTILNGGQLTMYVSKHTSGFAMAKAFGRALLGRWKGDPDLKKLVGVSFTIHTDRSRVQLANDGEVEWHETPLKYHVRPSALNIIHPAAA